MILTESVSSSIILVPVVLRDWSSIRTTQETMKKIVAITTGGTIASTKGMDGSLSATMDGAQLIRSLHLEDITVEVLEFSRLGSYLLSIEDVFQLARQTEAILAREDVFGVVITHGTDTMEESAFLLSLLVNSDKPVVLTGAQCSHDDPAGDGQGNLESAILAAASDLLLGVGPVVLFDSEIHAARFVTKNHTTQRRAFTSPGYGKIGLIDAQRVYVMQRPVRISPYSVPALETAVDVIRMYLGADGRFVRASTALGARGIVIDGFGRGNVPADVMRAMSDAVASGVVVLMSTRCPEGRVMPVYGNGSGGKDLEKIGVVFCGDLSGIKARLLLATVLKAFPDPQHAIRHINLLFRGVPLSNTAH